MNNRVRTNVRIFGMILFVSIGIISLIILRILHPYLFTSPDESVINWMNAPTCKVPCWMNIDPGETSLGQAKSLLLSNPKIKIIDESNILPYDGLLLFVSLQGEKFNTNVSIVFDKNNTAQRIEFSTSSKDLYLNDIVSFYGYPKYVVAYWPETVGVDFDLVYPETGLVINLYSLDANNEDGTGFVIRPGQEVWGISFYAPELEYYYSFAAWQPVKKYPWKGFANYP